MRLSLYGWKKRLLENMDLLCVVEIHDMFVDLSNLVSMQGEMVDRIEDHINSKYKNVPVPVPKILKFRK